MGIGRRGSAHHESRAARGNDAELLAAVAEGHVDALRVLHERHAPWLRVRLSRRCGDSDTVDAAIQDTFVALWRTAGRYEARGEDAGGWIWTIAIRRLISLLRTRSSGWIGQGDDLADADTPTQSAEDLVLLGVQHGDLGAALTALSPELRAVIQATVLDGLTVKEAAALLGIVQQGFPEELLWRGHLRDLLSDSLSPRTALILSSVVFGLLHIVSGSGAASVGERLLYMVVAVALGFVCGAARARTGAAWMAVGVHSGFHIGLRGIPTEPSNYTAWLVLLTTAMSVAGLLILGRSWSGAAQPPQEATTPSRINDVC